MIKQEGRTICCSHSCILLYFIVLFMNEISSLVLPPTPHDLRISPKISCIQYCSRKTTTSKSDTVRLQEVTYVDARFRISPRCKTITHQTRFSAKPRSAARHRCFLYTTPHTARGDLAKEARHGALGCQFTRFKLFDSRHIHSSEFLLSNPTLLYVCPAHEAMPLFPHHCPCGPSIHCLHWRLCIKWTSVSRCSNVRSLLVPVRIFYFPDNETFVFSKIYHRKKQKNISQGIYVPACMAVGAPPKWRDEQCTSFISLSEANGSSNGMMLYGA